MKSRRLLLGSSLVVAALVFGPIGIQLVMALQVASLPEGLSPLVKSLHALSFMFPLIWLVLAIGAPAFAIAGVFLRRLRIYLPTASVVCLASWLSLPIGWRLDSLRNPGLVLITHRAKPLIAAIESFRIQEGRYPSDLSTLVPRLLPAIPHTGAVGYPDFEYFPAGSNTLFRSYEVRVRTPIGGFNWDVFVYWPEQAYPQQMYGGVVERIGDWAYVHE